MKDTVQERPKSALETDIQLIQTDAACAPQLLWQIFIFKTSLELYYRCTGLNGLYQMTLPLTVKHADQDVEPVQKIGSM